LTGSLASPGIFEVMEVLGRDESLARLADAAAGPT
jgi:glutamyl-tRNA synthetase